MKHLLLLPLSAITVLGLAGCRDQLTPASPPGASNETGTPETALQTPGDSTESNARPITVSSYGSLADWDLDGNGQIEKSEFDQRLTTSHVFADWDGDHNGELTDLEFVTSLYKAWDINGD